MTMSPRHNCLFLRVAMGLVLSVSLGLGGSTGAEEAAPAPPKAQLKTCGKCPDGFAMTGVTEAPGICKDGDPTLVQCIPLGANMLPVCGSCPEGYVEIGSSSVPARCGTQDGGRLSQCQLQKMELNLPDPTQGRKICPPDCGSTPTPGQGAFPPPPKFIPPPENK
jgi:hypothetical protein